MENIREEFRNAVEKCRMLNMRINLNDLPERMNSFERNLIQPYYSNEELIKTVKYYMLQSNKDFEEYPLEKLPNSYRDSLKHKLIHLLLKRFEKLDKRPVDIILKEKIKKLGNMVYQLCDIIENIDKEDN